MPIRHYLYPILLLISPSVLAEWEVATSYNYGTHISTKEHNVGTSSSYRCAFSSTTFQSCYDDLLYRVVNNAEYYITSRQGDAYVYRYVWGTHTDSQYIYAGSRVYRMLAYDYNIDPQWVNPSPGSIDSGAYGVPATDQQCQSEYSGSFTRIPNIDLDQALVGVDIGACRFVANSSDTECYNNDGNQFCYSTWDVSSNGGDWYPGNPGTPIPSNDLPEYLTPTDDTSSCEYGSVAYGGQSYCYNSDVSDSTERSPGYGSGGTGGGDDGGGDGGSGGDGDGSGGGSGGTGGGGYGNINIEVPGLDEILAWLQTEPSEAEPDYPEDGPDAITREINVEDYTVNWSSGLSGGSCPGPEVVGLGRYGSITISYDGFCQFAGLLRYLVIAAAYASAAFLTFRGLV